MKIKLRLLLLSFFVGICLIYPSIAQEFDIKSKEDNSIHLSKDQLISLWKSGIEEIRSGTFDSKGNLIDQNGIVYILQNNGSAKQVIDDFWTSARNNYQIRKEDEKRIKFYNSMIIEEFPVIIPFGTNPGDDDDLDGVINTDDDDDDNDGILDVDEGLACNVPIPLGVDGSFENFAGVACNDGKNGSVTAAGWVNDGGTADTWIGDPDNPATPTAIPDIGLGRAGGGCSPTRDVNDDPGSAEGGECPG